MAVEPHINLDMTKLSKAGPEDLEQLLHHCLDDLHASIDDGKTFLANPTLVYDKLLNLIKVFSVSQNIELECISIFLNANCAHIKKLYDFHLSNNDIKHSPQDVASKTISTSFVNIVADCLEKTPPRTATVFASLKDINLVIKKLVDSCIWTSTERIYNHRQIEHTHPPPPPKSESPPKDNDLTYSSVAAHVPDNKYHPMKSDLEKQFEKVKEDVVAENRMSDSPTKLSVKETKQVHSTKDNKYTPPKNMKESAPVVPKTPENVPGRSLDKTVVSMKMSVMKPSPAPTSTTVTKPAPAPIPATVIKPAPTPTPTPAPSTMVKPVPVNPDERYTIDDQEEACDELLTYIKNDIFFVDPLKIIPIATKVVKIICVRIGLTQSDINRHIQNNRHRLRAQYEKMLRAASIPVDYPSVFKTEMPYAETFMDMFVKMLIAVPKGCTLPEKTQLGVTLWELIRDTVYKQLRPINR